MRQDEAGADVYRASTERPRDASAGPFSCWFMEHKKHVA
jgi:hypothetical protein